MSIVLFGGFFLYFLGVTLYIFISVSVLNSKIKKVNSESVSISQTMLKNNEKLSRFVLTKLILTKIEDLNKERFRYKDYLDQVSLLLPSGSQLTSVDFATKGWIAVSVKATDIFSFQLLENTLMNPGTWKGSNYFSSAYVERVSKEKDGSYSTRLQLELKKVNG